ncbi:GTP 3',8-cyclase MoaA [Agromyces seonyuensis]|uniref:GTP 3',8-cyclase n=1 Tax=Agromyces seonyuensis TaxID=2662446 RepID=A0A6I4P0I7_9MICO|nr:GTP 3',8-cyclase MoaA [Agromyces seonyuensis]MWB97519.1 GTP 3',8-cyclase MoaA [Agromyces seonyuensis]
MAPTALGIPLVRGATARADAAGRPDAAGLVDRFGRMATDLRVSLTDRCNLRCTYCMPAEGLPSIGRERTMTADEIERLVRIGVERLGVRQVRFTGGEPLLRADLVDIVARIAAIEPRPEISLTTNAIGLDARAGKLKAAGLDRLNVSLDSLRHDTFEAVTRRPFLDRVLAGIAAADEAGFAPIKLNAVLLPGVNEDESIELLDWALEHGYELRFIEQMPLDADHSWNRRTMVTAAELRETIGRRRTLAPDEAPRDGAPAERFAVLDGGGRRLGTLGIIASVTEPFCADCRRTRLTAEGDVRSCLFSHEEYGLLQPLRDGESDAELADRWRAAMWVKPAGHELGRADFVQPERTMSAIGG